MAYFLFDDVLTIGKDTQASNHALHLVLLDGIYIPLSFMFKLMADAITKTANEIENNPSNVFKVTIDSGKIAFPKPEQWLPGAWETQREIAYKQIKISARFMASFAEIISSIFK